ncbi:MarR family winged helix-turn-helix transcriptional regulator [Streptomyces sp. NBC_01304]|uniref:MarR family winged helix-turn-helix transcriptional regulator n=1 Tax=Streptomyces sp. NBC_01304 TaxID=2903818 RepID=UPI002E102F0C|nr:MarR family transcriptional regulator [Streptomyces sp. NBC_01304]
MKQDPTGERTRGERTSGAERDWADGHVARWLPVLPDLDLDIEGAVTRMQKLTVHLRRVREQSLGALDLERQEFDTLHKLAGRGGTAAPSDLAADLDLARASITGRLDTLERRGFVRRTPSRTDRRRVDVELTEEGRRIWHSSMEAIGHEEHRLFGVLSKAERTQLADMMRQIMLLAERDNGAQWTDCGPRGRAAPEAIGSAQDL